MIDVADIHPRGAMAKKKFEPLAKEIFTLKKQLNAVILAHNYQVPEIQDVADYVGDSLGLSQQAAKTSADVIVFCGVHFMAETAKILNPNKIVVLPDKDAGCSLEESCPADKLAELQRTNPNFWTIAYINCSAAVKALTDVICTSGNAEKIVRAAPKDKDILFVPDENLGQWVMEQTGRKMTLWKGNCYAHVEFQRERVLAAKRQFPDAKIVVHPESLREVRELADSVCSTEKMITYCKTSPARRFVIVTESGIIHRMQRECPDKEFFCAPVFNAMKLPTDGCRCSECKFMKLNTLEKVRDCMKQLAPRIELPADIIKRARLPIERMLEISAKPVENAG
jgi:quinolinate synthase